MVLTTTNYVELCGTVVAAPKEDHVYKGEQYYRFVLEVYRKSGIADVIPVIINSAKKDIVEVGDRIIIFGRYNSFNINKHLDLYVTAREIVKASSSEDFNEAFIDGFICRQPVFRITPHGRKITELLIASHRPNKKSDYFPCICWGATAELAKKLKVGDLIETHCRIQSREYMKNDAKHLTYELSVNKFVLDECSEEEGTCKSE